MSLVPVKLEPLSEQNEGEEILPTVANNYHVVEKGNHVGAESRPPLAETHLRPKRHETTNQQSVNTRSVIPSPEKKVKRVLKSRIYQRNLNTKGRVVKHYLAENFDLSRFPGGWAPMFSPYNLRFFRIKKDSVLMYVDVNGNREIFINVQNEELPKSHPIHISLLQYCSVSGLADLVDLIDKLDDWAVCAGVSEKQYVDYYQKNGNPVECRFVPQLLRLFSLDCERLLPPEEKQKVCFECKVLRRKCVEYLRFNRRGS